MDAISRAIYWQGMPERGVNSNAVEFLRYMNQGLKERHPSVILAAEDSTSFPGVTKPAEEGGLGFDYKWDMGWMNDTLDYFRTAPEYRTRNYHKLTFSMMYYYDERYLLPLSHDEVRSRQSDNPSENVRGLRAEIPSGESVLYVYVRSSGQEA